MIWHVVGLHTGYIEIAANGWVENKSLDRALDVDQQLLDSLRSKDIHTISPRIFSYGLINHKENSKFVSIMAAEFEKERRIITLHEKMIEGRYPNARDSNVAIIGRGLARTMGLVPGSKINIVTSQFDGSIGAASLTVVGIYRAADVALDTTRIYTSLETGRVLFAPDPTEDQIKQSGHAFARYTSIGLGIENYLVARQVFERLSQFYPLPKIDDPEDRGNSNNYSPVAYNWDVLNPGIIQLVLLDQVSGEMTIAFLLMILAAGIFNNVQMSIQERLREFGILLGIGMRPGQIVWQLLLELMLVFIPALICGMLGGIGLGHYFHINPITMTGDSAQMYIELGFQPRIPALVDLTELWIAVLSILLPAVFFAILASRRIYKLHPIEIINTI